MTNAISHHPDHPWLIPGRLLAALVDYLIVSAFSSLAARLGLPFDWLFIFTFFAGCLYFGFGNSRWSNGQTLGKRAFGVQTCRGNNLLSFRQAAARYFLSIGIVILIIELPPLYFRSSGLVAPLAVLEAPMLLALLLLGWQVASILSSAGTIALHDRVVGSNVNRRGAVNYRGKNHRMTIPGAVFSSILVILWLGQIQLPPLARSLYEKRFLIERVVPTLRILQVVEDESAVSIHAAATSTEGTSQTAIADHDAAALESLLPRLMAPEQLSKKITLALHFGPENSVQDRELHPGYGQSESRFNGQKLPASP